MAELILGPLLRYVDETTAALWVETSRAAVVRVIAGGRGAEASTFAVHGHHYALVCLDDLEPGTRTAYRVEVDGPAVWPEADSDLPDPVIATLPPEKQLRIAFGSCRTSV